MKLVYIFAVIASISVLAYVFWHKPGDIAEGINLSKSTEILSPEKRVSSVSSEAHASREKVSSMSEDAPIDLILADENPSLLGGFMSDDEVRQFREQEAKAFQDRLRSKPAQIQAFFEQGNATYEEWTLAYEFEMCQCKTMACMKGLEADYLKFNPPFSDKVRTSAAVESLHKVVACVSALPQN